MAMALHGAPAADSRLYGAPLPLHRIFRCTGWCEALVPLAAACRDIADVVSRDAGPARAQGCLAPRAAGRNLALGAAVWGWGIVQVALREMYHGMAGGWGALVFSGSHHLRFS